MTLTGFVDPPDMRFSKLRFYALIKSFKTPTSPSKACRHCRAACQQYRCDNKLYIVGVHVTHALH